MKKFLSIILALALLIFASLIYLSRVDILNTFTDNLIETGCNYETLNAWLDSQSLKPLEQTDNTEIIQASLNNLEPSFNPLQLINTVKLNGDVEKTNINYSYSSPILPTSIRLSVDNTDKPLKTQIKIPFIKNNSDSFECIFEREDVNSKSVLNIEGSLSEEDFLKGIKGTLVNPDNLFFPDSVATKNTTILKAGSGLLNEIELKEFIEEPVNNFLIGKIKVEKGSKEYLLSVFYDSTQDKIKFSISELNLLINTLAKDAGNYLALECTDCTLAPASKQFSLPSKYYPAVKYTGLSGGGQLTPTTINSLNTLINNAKKEGIDITIISAFRSYSEQVSTFNYWVSREMAKGSSRYVAEAAANNYSARAGQSEHQLGTTADLKCSTCGNFDNSSGNIKMYNFLKNNAHKYGFVISYPEGKKDRTGYNTELWHIRYIGVNYATELYNLNYTESNDEYLLKFILEKNLF